VPLAAKSPRKQAVKRSALMRVEPGERFALRLAPSAPDRSQQAPAGGGEIDARDPAVLGVVEALDESLALQPADHLAHARWLDRQPLGQLALARSLRAADRDDQEVRAGMEPQGGEPRRQRGQMGPMRGSEELGGVVRAKVVNQLSINRNPTPPALSGRRLALARGARIDIAIRASRDPVPRLSCPATGR